MGKTLYETVERWTKEPWNGDKYLHFARKLYGHLNIEGVSAGYLGKTVTRLESYISEVIETIDMGLDTQETAKEGLERLLKDKIFAKGARDIEANFETLEFKVLKPGKATA